MIPAWAARRILATLAGSATRACPPHEDATSTQCRDPRQPVGEDGRKRGLARGYDGVKKIRGRKRHILVDTQGFVLKAVVHAADVPDRDGAESVLTDLLPSFPRLELVWMDQGYRGERLKQWMVTQHLRQYSVAGRILEARRSYSTLPEPSYPSIFPQLSFSAYKGLKPRCNRTPISARSPWWWTLPLRRAEP